MISKSLVRKDFDKLSANTCMSSFYITIFLSLDKRERSTSHCLSYRESPANRTFHNSMYQIGSGSGSHAWQIPFRSPPVWTPDPSAWFHAAWPSPSVGSRSESRCHCPAVRSCWHSSPSGPGSVSILLLEPADPAEKSENLNWSHAVALKSVSCGRNTYSTCRVNLICLKLQSSWVRVFEKVWDLYPL